MNGPGNPGIINGPGFAMDGLQERGSFALLRKLDGNPQDGCLYRTDGPSCQAIGIEGNRFLVPPLGEDQN